MSGPNLSLTQIKALVALADTGSFTAASERLGVTQPAISHAIRQAEEMLQQPLFERQRDRTVPNAAGLLALAEARLALTHLERLEFAVKGQAALQSGSLRLGCFSSAVHWLLPAALAEFSRRYPAVELHVRELADDSCVAAILERRIDLGMVNLPCAELWTHPIFEDDICIVASGDIEISGDLRQFKDQPFVLPKGALERIVEAAFIAAGVKPRTSASVAAHGPALTLALVKASRGYTLMPRSALNTENMAELAAAPVEPRIVRHVAFAAASEQTASPAARAFLDLIAENPRPEPPSLP